MNTCPTCGRPTINGSVYFIRDMSLAFLADSIVVNGQPIALTPCEYIVAKTLFKALGSDPVAIRSFIWDLYAYNEPNYAEVIVKCFIHHIRRKLHGTDLAIRNFPPRKYGFVEARKAA